MSALVLPQFDYSISSWYAGIYKSLQHKLQIAQNKVVRFLLNCSPRTHLGRNEFRLANLLCIKDRAKQLRLNHMFNIFTGTCPPYIMLLLFARLSDMYSYETRGNQFNFHVPKVNTVSKQSFYYNCITDWNSLPNYIKAIETITRFKLTVKNYIEFQHHHFSLIIKCIYVAACQLCLDNGSLWKQGLAFSAIHGLVGTCTCNALFVFHRCILLYCIYL